MAYSHYKYALNNTQVKDGGPVVAWIWNASYIVFEEKRLGFLRRIYVI